MGILTWKRGGDSAVPRGSHVETSNTTIRIYKSLLEEGTKNPISASRKGFWDESRGAGGATPPREPRDAPGEERSKRRGHPRGQLRGHPQPGAALRVTPLGLKCPKNAL